MSDKQSRQFQACMLAAGLVAWSATAGLDVPARRHPLMQAGLASGLAALTRARLGLRPPALWAGVRLGSAAAVLVALGVVAASSHPRVRAAMAQRELPDRTLRWLAVQIPIGTVWSEEVAYRGALATVAADAFGQRTGRLVQSAAFGLSHIPDARATGEPMALTVIATGVAGWVFSWLADRSGSVAAPMLAHLAINEAGALAALTMQSG